MFRLEIEHGQFSEVCVLAAGERPAQIVSNQEFEGEEHVNNDGTELESDTAYRVYSLALARYPGDRDKNKRRSFLTERDVSTFCGTSRIVGQRGLRSTNGLDDEGNHVLEQLSALCEVEADKACIHRNKIG